MLLKFFLNITIVFLFLSCNKFKKNEPAYLSIENIEFTYLRNCAWINDLHSREWQTCLDSAIVKKPKYSYLYQQKAMPFIKSGDYYNAIKNLDKAVRIDQKYLDYRAFIKLFFLRDYDGAIEDFKQANRLFPDSYIMDHDYNFYLALAFLMKKELDISDYYFSKSFELEFSHGFDWVHYLNYYYYSILKFEMNENDLAFGAINSCLKLYRDFPDALYWKAKILMKLDKNEKALEVSEKAFLYLKQGNTNNEDNERYVNYPYQISEVEIVDIIKKIEQYDN